MINPCLEFAQVEADDTVAQSFRRVEMPHRLFILAQIISRLAQGKVDAYSLRGLQRLRFECSADAGYQPGVLRSDASTAYDVVIAAGEPGRLLNRAQEVAA